MAQARRAGLSVTPEACALVGVERGELALLVGKEPREAMSSARPGQQPYSWPSITTRGSSVVGHAGRVEGSLLSLNDHRSDPRWGRARWAHANGAVAEADVAAFLLVTAFARRRARDAPQQLGQPLGILGLDVDPGDAMGSVGVPRAGGGQAEVSSAGAVRSVTTGRAGCASGPPKATSNQVPSVPR